MNRPILLALSALWILLMPGCQRDPQSGNSEEAEALPYEALAGKLTQGFEADVISQAKLKAENAAEDWRSARRIWRENEEKKYKAARERREKVKPVPRASLPGFESFNLPEIRHNALIAELYDVENSPLKPIFAVDGELTPAGLAVLKTIQTADAHALNPDDFHADLLDAAAKRLARMHETLSQQGRMNLNQAETRAIAKAIESELADLMAMSGQAQKDALISSLCDPEHTPVPRAAAMCEREIERQKEFANLNAALEFALADAWLGWAEAMKYGNLEKISDEEREKYASDDNPNDIHPKHHDKLIEDRLRNMAASVMANPAQIDAKLDGLIPKHEQYPKLQAVRQKYREIVEAGGWKIVPPDRMFAGGRAPLIKNLKERLAAEDYYTGPINDTFDPPLTLAIKKYQQHHQLEETGEVGDVFWRSLNVPADQRLAQIEVNIRRWHKTLFEPRDAYVYVNLPSFTLELWHDGERVSSHKTVIGNSTKICNTRTREWELINATRMMHTHLTYLVFNPYWNVPPRIEVDEYQKKMAEDPKWLEKSDFEYVNPRGGGRVLRQKPGENNALGKVKLIFPNRYGIYFHDTPKKDMFKYVIRAFSHGCMRVEGAMKFAREVLEIDNQWDQKVIDKFFRESGEHPLELKKPLDVFIEYHTVTVDNDGSAYFLADVYKIIQDEISPPSDLDKRCNPAVDRTSTYRSGGSDDNGP